MRAGAVDGGYMETQASATAADDTVPNGKAAAAAVEAQVKLVLRTEKIRLWEPPYSLVRRCVRPGHLFASAEHRASNLFDR